MDSNVKIEDFAGIDHLMSRARLERNVYMANAIAGAIRGTARWLRHAAQAMQRGYDAELDRRAIEADTFLRRSVSHY
jgi:hypothetical protein